MEDTSSIVEEIRQNREKGSARLVVEYRDRLYAAALSLCGDAAKSEDLVFATFESVLDKIDMYSERDAFYGWMYTIMLNHYRKSVRGSMVKNTVPIGGSDDLAAIGPQLDADTVIASIDGDIVRAAVDHLPPKLRDMVVLHYFMDMPLWQIAKFLTIPIGTVQRRLYMARKVLAIRLGAKLKKPAVAMIAAGLMLLGATAAVVVGVDALAAPESGGTRSVASETGGTQSVASETGGTCSSASSEIPSDENPPTTSSPQPSSNNQPENEKGEKAMNIKQKAKAVVSSAVKYALLAVGVNSTTLAASVYDDARVWFRGGYDANGDGVFTSSEFVDSARPKSDAAHQTVTITGSGAGYGKGAVWSSYNPFYTNTQYYASFPNGNRANSSDCTAFNLVNPLAAGESWSQYSIFIRFRWDGDFAPGNNNMLYVLDTGLNWNGKRGIWFGFKYFSETDDFAPFCYAGQSSDVPSATKGIKIPVGEWQDIMITVIDRGVGSYASINLYMGSAGTVTNPGGLWPGLSDADSGRTKRVRLESTDVIKIGYAGFSGDIAEWALWPKVLSYDEMREAFGALRPGDALFRIGKEDGKADELAAPGHAQYAIDANGTWDVVPSTLDQTHDMLTIDFDVHANWHYLNQILRLVAVSGNGWIEGTVTDPVRNRSVDLKSRKLEPGHPADFFVPHDYLMTGPHTLTLRLVRGSGVTFDVIEMRGSFCLGQIDYNKSKNVQFEGTAKNSGTVVYPYDVASGYWRAMSGGVANNTFSTSGTWEGNSGASTETTFFFDMPVDLVGCTNTFYVSYNNFYARIDAPDAIRGYFNDICFYDSSTTADGKEWDWEVAYTNVPPNTLVSGRNTFRLRRTYTGSGTWWGGTRGFRIEIQNAPPRDKMGIVISFK